MAAKTPIDKLGAAIADILDEYVDQVNASVGEIAEKLAKKGTQTLRNVSKSEFKGGTGKYAKGWSVETTGKRHRQLEQSSVIYNKHPGMPHLLEYGHVIRNGTNRVYGKVSGREHIAPVEEKLVGTFMKEVMAKL